MFGVGNTDCRRGGGGSIIFKTFINLCMQAEGDGDDLHTSLLLITFFKHKQRNIIPRDMQYSVNMALIINISLIKNVDDTVFILCALVSPNID
jgi:hypothetical protein